MATGEHGMERRQWLLMFLGLPTPDHPEGPPLDPVRIMKGMFLLRQRTPLAKGGEAYDFIPYLYGPCSFEVYGDLDRLVGSGLVAAEQPWGRAWSLYTPTAQGRKEAKRLEAEIDPKTLAILREIKQYVTSTPFRRLLREIYEQYPDYATQSVLTPQ